MTELKAISDKIYSVETSKSPQDFVNNFELYQDIIEKMDPNSSLETHTLLTRLTADYGIALTSIRNYKKAIPVLNWGLDLLINDKTIDKEKIKNVKFYEVLIFNRGVCNYYLKNYSEAKNDFITLTQLYSHNITYKNWLTAVDSLFLIRIKNILWMVVFLFLLIEKFLKHYNLPNEIFLLTAVLSIILAVVLEIIIHHKKKQVNADS